MRKSNYYQEQQGQKGQILKEECTLLNSSIVSMVNFNFHSYTVVMKENILVFYKIYIEVNKGKGS